jgi:hypothetical protein
MAVFLSFVDLARLPLPHEQKFHSHRFIAAMMTTHVNQASVNKCILLPGKKLSPGVSRERIAPKPRREGGAVNRQCAQRKCRRGHLR